MNLLLGLLQLPLPTPLQQGEKGLLVAGGVARLARSAESAAAKKHGENRITFRPHFYFGETNQEIDFVFFLNGLPIVALEVKHEQNQNVHDAVAQFAARDPARRIFQHPFLYLAADTSDVMAATDPRRVENFRWHNSGLTNAPLTEGEYPVEFLYREVLAKDSLLEMLSFFLVRVPRREAQPRARRRRTAGAVPRPAVEHAKAKRPEMHVPEAVVDRLDADRLAGERLADEHLIAAPLDGAIPHGNLNPRADVAPALIQEPP